MAEHVNYEMQQMGQAASLIASGQFPTEGAASDVQRVVGNALLESALRLIVAHPAFPRLRSIDDFFGRTTGRDDDVFAVDYLPAWESIKVLTDKERTSINKLLAHLTVERRGPRLKWELARVREAGSVYHEFAAALRASWPLRFAWFNVELKGEPEPRRGHQHNAQSSGA